MRKHFLIFTLLIFNVSVFAQKKQNKKRTPPPIKKEYEIPPVIQQESRTQNEMEYHIVAPMSSLTRINATKTNGEEIKIDNINELKTIDFSKIKKLNIETSLSDRFLENEILEKILNETTQLEELKIRNFTIEKFPEIKGINKHLKVLSLEKANLKIIPSSVSNLIALEYFSLDYNFIEELPTSFSQLKNLKKLSLQNVEFSEFPKEIFDLNKLSVLYISGNYKGKNRIKEIPDNFYSLSELKEFTVKDAGLSTLPKSISTLTKLEKVDFSSNQFEDFPEVLAVIPSLEFVPFTNNPLNWEKFLKSIKSIKWRGLFFLNGTGFSKKQYEEIQKILPKIDVYYDEMND